MRVIVVGGGIGGLAAALSLHAAGITDVRVMEAAAEIRPIGVGLNVLPNAVRELAELGVHDRLAEHAVATSELRLHNRYGALIWAEPRGTAAGYRWPQLSIHRGRLQAILADEVRARLGGDAICTGTRLVSCSAGDRGPEATFETGDGTEVERADVLVGADGIRSAVRASLYPQEGPPPTNGLVMWRGVSWAEPFLTGSSMVVSGTDEERIVLYPIDRNAEGTRALINWVIACPAAGLAPSGEWHERVGLPEALDHVRDWSFDWLDVPAVVAAAAKVYRYPMADREPLPCWRFGAVTLLGDAAHAMYPMGSNGATQAIMDARVLALALAEHDDIPTGLTRYEAMRRPTVTQLQASNRRHGPEAVISLVHQRAPDGFKRLADVISETELADISAGYARAAGFDVQYVNTRPSLSVRRLKGSS